MPEGRTNTSVLSLTDSVYERLLEERIVGLVGRLRPAWVRKHMPEGRTNTSGLSLTVAVYERWLQERIVVLGSEVNDDVANRITAQLLLLSAEDPESDIRFYINSPGGSV